MLRFLLYPVWAVAWAAIVTSRRIAAWPRAYAAAYAPYERGFERHGDRAAWLASINAAPSTAAQLYAAHWAYEEIQNGGFWQYFFKSAGAAAPEARDGFRAMGLPEAATLIQRAMDRVGLPFPESREARRAVVGEPDLAMDFDAETAAFLAAAGSSNPLRKPPRYIAYADALAAHSADMDEALEARAASRVGGW